MGATLAARVLDYLGGPWVITNERYGPFVVLYQTPLDIGPDEEYLVHYVLVGDDHFPYFFEVAPNVPL